MSKRNVIILESALQEAFENFSFNVNTELDDKFEILANLFLEQAVHAMAHTSSKDAMIGAGIAIEKMQLLRGLPTEIKASIPLLMKIAERASDENVALTTVLTKLLNAMNE